MSRQCQIEYFSPGAAGPAVTPQFELEPLFGFQTGKNCGGTVELCLIRKPPQQPFLSTLPEKQKAPEMIHVVVKSYVPQQCDPPNEKLTPHFLTLRQREACQFQRFYHNTVRVYGADNLTSPTFIITEYCEFGSLREVLCCRNPNVLKPLATRFSFCRAVGYQALMGLAYMHEVLKIMHRDINPKNLLIDQSGRIRISDFLSSSAVQRQTDRKDSLDGPTAGALVRMLAFRAPELPENPNEGLAPFADQDWDPFALYGFQVDIYSLGLVLLELLDGIHVDQCDREIPPTKEEFLKRTKNRLDVLASLVQQEVNLQGKEKQSGLGFVDLLRKMTDPDPSRRPSAVDAAKDNVFHPSHFPPSLVDPSNESVLKHREGRMRSQLAPMQDPPQGEVYVNDYQGQIAFLQTYDEAHSLLLYHHEYPHICAIRSFLSQLQPYRPEAADPHAAHHRFGSYLSDG